MLGRFLSADTIVPDSSNPQSLNRYAYVRNSPLNRIDPSGHSETEGCDTEGCSATQWDKDRATGNAEKAKLSKYYRDCATTGGPQCENLRQMSILLEVAGSMLLEPVDWVLTARDCINGDCSGALLGALPFVSGATRKLFGVADDLGGAGRAVNRADDALDSLGDAARKQPPNPNGRRGGLPHQGVVDDIVNSAPSGTKVKTEFYVPTPGGMKSKRFVDVAYLDVNGDPIQFFQVGRMNKNGMPVPREVDAASDIIQFGPYDLPIDFVPYN